MVIDDHYQAVFFETGGDRSIVTVNGGEVRAGNEATVASRLASEFILLLLVLLLIMLRQEKQVEIMWLERTTKIRSYSLIIFVTYILVSLALFRAFLVV